MQMYFGGAGPDMVGDIADSKRSGSQIVLPSTEKSCDGPLDRERFRSRDTVKVPPSATTSDARIAGIAVNLRQSFA